MRLRTAVNLGQRPTAALLTEANPQGEWTKTDYILMDAYFTMEREICKTCGNPVWLCHSTDNRIEFKADIQACYAKAEIEEFSQTPKGKNLSAGEYIVARPIGLEDGRGNYEPLPSRREAYNSMPDD